MVWGDGNNGDFEMLQDISASAIGDLVAVIELFNEVNGTDYDGIILPTETVIFSSEQAKLITNKNPTNSPDIRYKVSAAMAADYMEAVNRGDTETEQMMVDEAAKAAGFDSPKLYHGTTSFGFTRFNPALSNDKIAIFATNSKAIAQTYSGGNAEKTRVSERSGITPEQLETAKPETILKLLQDNVSKNIEMVSEREHNRFVEENREKVRSAVKQAENLAAKWGINKNSKEILRQIVSSLKAMETANNRSDLELAEADFRSAKNTLQYKDGGTFAELSKRITKDVDSAYKMLSYYLDTALYRQSGENAKLFNSSELYKKLFNGVYELYANPGKQFVFDVNGANVRDAIRNLR